MTTIIYHEARRSTFRERVDKEHESLQAHATLRELRLT